MSVEPNAYRFITVSVCLFTCLLIAPMTLAEQLPETGYSELPISSSPLPVSKSMQAFKLTSMDNIELVQVHTSTPAEKISYQESEIDRLNREWFLAYAAQIGVPDKKAPAVYYGRGSGSSGALRDEEKADRITNFLQDTAESRSKYPNSFPATEMPSYDRFADFLEQLKQASSTMPEFRNGNGNPDQLFELIHARHQERMLGVQ